MTPDKKQFILGVDLDADESRIHETYVKFLKNLQYDVNDNPNSASQKGDNMGVLTPVSGNVLLPVELPEGTNKAVLNYFSKETNELYVGVWNSENDHLIYRINATGSIQKVYQGACLNFVNDPRHFIMEGRCFVRKQTYKDYDGQQKERKFFGYVDNNDDIRLISVEDSIATDSFNPTLFPYFDVQGYSCSPCYLINLAVAHSMKCIEITNVERTTDEEKRKQNLTVNNGWQFRIRNVDVFGRRSAWGIISDLYMTILGGNCVQNNNSLPRCYNLSIDAGCPLTDKIEIAFSKNHSDWFLYDTIIKYDNCEGVAWYEREITAENYNPESNTFDYIFCGDKECLPIDINETDLNFLDVPLTASSLGPLNQGIFTYNNVKGFDPLSCNEIEKAEINVIPPTGVCEEERPVRTIITYVPIIAPHTFDRTMYLWKSSVPGEDYLQWGAGQSLPPRYGPNAYNQILNKGETGFLGYLAGTKFTCRSEQVYLNLLTGAEVPFPPPTYPTTVIIGSIFVPVSVDNMLVHKFTFHVPAGKYSFRLAAHLIEPGVDYQKTSTQTYGIAQLSAPSVIVSDFHELIIDCCEQDVILNGPTDECIVMVDMSINGRAIVGTLKEDNKTNNPLEYVELNVTGKSTGLGFCPRFTDFNGKMWGYSLMSSTSLWSYAFVCALSPSADYYITLGSGAPGNGYFLDAGYRTPIGTSDWQEEDRRYIRGKISICDTEGEFGVAGVLVVCKNGPAVRTDSSGEYEIMLHNKNLDFGATDLIFLSQSGSCVVSPCDDPCSGCFTDENIPYAACGPDRTIENVDWEVGITGNNKGLENGGRYAVGFTMHDWAGRHGNIQSHEGMYFNTLPMTETHAFGFSTIAFDITGMVFPLWVKYVTFWITENLNNTDRLMWIADKVEFIDNGGNIVGKNASPTKIRIYYESLAEYNKQNNFATTTNMQILETDSERSVVGDYVEFIRNGPTASNAWFDGTIQAQVVYDKDGRYFDIEFQQDLSGLVDEALIKFVRPKNCIQKHIFYELCTTIRVTNGIPETVTGILPAFDSYFINRQIPIPVYTTINGEVVKSVNTKWTTNLFEHHSPSDFWGNHILNKGRINVKNPYERQQRNIQEVAYSAALVDKSNFNGLNYFLPENVTSFPEQEWGAGVLAFTELNTFLAICEHNNFVAGFNDNILRVDQNGNVMVPSADDKFGKPQRKIGSDYGCQPIDINSIRRHIGYVYFVDANRNAVLRHDYESAKDMSIGMVPDYVGYKGYLTQKIALIKLNDAPIDFFFTAGIDPLRNEYILSVATFQIGEENPPVYITEALEPAETIQETISINTETGVLKRFEAYIPEAYGVFPGYFKGAAMFIFREGLPYTGDFAAPSCNFFGIQTKKVIEVVSNISPETVKVFMYNEVNCSQHKFVVDKVLTEASQESRIRAPYWEKINKFWAAPFLCNLNVNFKQGTPAEKMIIEGDSLFGKWAKVRYISEDADDNKYCELSAIVIYVNKDEKSAE